MREIKFRVVAYPAIEISTADNISFRYPTIEQATAARDAMAGLLIFVQDKMSAMPDYSNIIILERKNDLGEWEDIEDDD